MQRKKLIVMGIGAIVVIAGILGYFMIHNDTEIVETMAESDIPVVAEESGTAENEEDENVEEAPKSEESTATAEVMENTADIEQEPDIVQEVIEQNIVEMPENEGMEEIDTYLYTTADLNMRKEGTTESEVIGSIPYGTKIHVTARTADNWYRTERGEIGYVSGKYLSEEEPAPQQQAQAQTSNNGISGYNRYGEYIEGVSQEDLDLLDSLIPDYEPYDPSKETPAPMEGGGGHSIYR